jgi:hypothetical protein
LTHNQTVQVAAKHQKNRPNQLAPKTQSKRFKIKQFGRFIRVYLVQSVHAPHSEEVNAARASRLAGYAELGITGLMPSSGLCRVLRSQFAQEAERRPKGNLADLIFSA